MSNYHLGWDIGGAHLKAALLNPQGQIQQVFQQACPLWKGLNELHSAFTQILQQINPNITRVKPGLKRSRIQIVKTIKYEIHRNFSKLISTTIFTSLLFLLFFAMNQALEAGGADIPANTTEYVKIFMKIVSMVINIIAISFAGSIISEDFEKQTGNLIFPKIPKKRLLVGRVIARYFLASIALLSFFLLVAGITSFKYEESLPVEFWQAFGWSELYLFAVMAFVTLFSSIMKKSLTAMILSFMMMLMIFTTLITLTAYLGVTSEPFYYLTYYSNIILSCFNMPANRQIARSFVAGPPGTPVGENELTYMTWSTPSVTGAFWGMIIYSIVCLTLSYFLFKRRQNSN